MFTLNHNKKYLDVSKKNITAGFGTKQLGDGRDRNLLNNYFKDKVLVTPRQSHSNTLVEYKSGDELSPNNCDGVITKEKNVILTVITADCLPIMYHDEVASIIGISHQGWKGTLEHLPSVVIQKMIEIGSTVENIHCIFGPAINDCCYEFYEDRLKNFQNEFKSDFIFRKKDHNYFLNLYKANYISLQNIGILPQNISYFPFCTSCDSYKFYSYKRDGQLLGEMVSFVMLNEGEASRHSGSLLHR